MGYMRANAIVVTSWDRDELLNVHAYAPEAAQ